MYIGGIRDRPEEVAALLGLPPLVFATFDMGVGYPDPAKTAVLHRETYQLAAQTAQRCEERSNLAIAPPRILKT